MNCPLYGEFTKTYKSTHILPYREGEDATHVCNFCLGNFCEYHHYPQYHDCPKTVNIEEELRKV